MTSEMTAAKMALLMKLANKEASRRQRHQVSSAPSRREEDGIDAARPSSVTIEDVEAIEEETRELEVMLRDERASNDVEWEKVRQKLASLDEEQLANSDETNPPSKQTELAMLEHEIAFITKELPTLDVPLNDFAISLKTREMLVSSIEQHEAGVHMKRSELERQRRLLHQDEETWRNLKDVRRGLEAKRARLIQKEEEAQDRGSALDALRQRVKAVEGSLARFLTLVIEICDSLYEDRDRSKSMQLKHLVDRLVNTAWDSPDNPWIDVSEQYLPSIVTFLVRANIAVEHPRDARNLRLVDFHR